MKVLVSACLLGEMCKYNSESNYNQRVIDFLKDDEIISICPEVMGAKRTFTDYRSWACYCYISVSIDSSRIYTIKAFTYTLCKLGYISFPCGILGIFFIIFGIYLWVCANFKGKIKDGIKITI